MHRRNHWVSPSGRALCPSQLIQGEYAMKINVGNLDRTIRIAVAVIIGVLFAMNIISGTLGIILLVVAGIFLLTGVISRCPIYSVLGLSTCKKHQATQV